MNDFVMPDAWVVWRVINMALATLAIGMHIYAIWHLRLWRYAASDEMMGILSVIAWCAGYNLAVTVAILKPGGEPGPWTAVMTAPIVWTVVAGVLLSRERSPRV